MDNAIIRTIYHPLIALPSLYLTDLMFSVDFSVTAALLRVASGLLIRLTRLLTRTVAAIRNDQRCYA
jgi:hypothetical protein